MQAQSEEPAGTGRAVARAALGLALGVLLWLAGSLVRALLRPAGPHESARGRPAVWLAADRDGDELVELDEFLFVLRRTPVERPLFVRAGARGVWVVHAAEGAPRGPHQLVLGPCAADLRPVAVLGEALDLAVDAQGRALVLVRVAAAGVQIERFDGAGEACVLAVPPGAQRISAEGGTLGLALGSGGWARWDAGAQDWVVSAALPGEQVCDLACGPAGTWWLLQARLGEPGAHLLGLDAQGVPRVQHEVGAPRRLARGTQAAAWLWSLDGRTVQRRGAGAPQLDLGLALAGGRAAVVDQRGGLLVAAAGALMRLDEHGRALPGQGGFVRLVDLAALDSGAQGP